MRTNIRKPVLPLVLGAIGCALAGCAVSLASSSLRAWRVPTPNEAGADRRRDRLHGLRADPRACRRGRDLPSAYRGFASQEHISNQ